MRGRDDVDRMSAELPTVSRVAVIGGGYIGLEAASVLARLGKHVTILEAQDRVLARVAGTALSHFFEDEHRTYGVDLRVGVAVEGIEEHDGRAAGVRLSTGEIIPADMVIVGIGIQAAVDPLLAVGGQGGNGIEVDAFCRTSLPHVYAGWRRCDHSPGVCSKRQ